MTRDAAPPGGSGHADARDGADGRGHAGGRGGAARLAVALFVLNGALTFENLWPTPAVVPALAFSVEAALLVLSLAALHAAGRAPGARTLSLLALLATVLALGHYVDVTVPALFGRPINLFWDGRHVPRVLALAASEMPAWQLVAITGAVALALWLPYRLLRGALRWASAAFEDPHLRRLGAVVALAVVGLYALTVLRNDDVLAGYLPEPVATTYAHQARFLHAALSPARADAILPPSPPFSAGVEGLRGADVLLVFLESYGVTALDTPAQAAALATPRAALAAALADSGRRAVSARVRSPTFGGASWLAHASLLAGIDTEDPAHYHLLLTTSRPTLVGHFRAQGYTAVALMPGLRAAWPEGAFYGYDRIYDSDALDYAGPAFGFWRIPDQYALARLDALELRTQPRHPRLVVFPTIVSHIPFRPVPPYARDWQALAVAPRFAPAALERSLQQGPDWTDLAPAYVDSLAYSFEWLAGYLRERAPRSLVTIVIGDHQPAATVSGRHASWDVPIHVLTDNEALLERLQRAGFDAGLEPKRPALGPMHALTPLLVEAFGACDSAACAEPRVDVSGRRALGQPLQPAADLAGAAPAIAPQLQRFAR
jgi:hypothetical protein